MSEDHFVRSKIKAEPAPANDGTIIKLEGDEEQRIDDYEFRVITQHMVSNYSATKNKFGSFAVTDKDRQEREGKDQRFSLSPLLRGPLAVEDEEKRYIEERVRSRIKAIQDEATERAREKGYQDGLKKGHDEAYAKFREEGAKRLQELDSFLKYCEDAKKEIFEANEKLILELIYQIAKMVILKEVRSDDDYVVRLGKSLVDSIGVKENITIKVSQEDMKSSELLKKDLTKTLGTLRNVNVVASDEIKDGGVIVETQWNSIDASISTQLSNIYQALLDKDLSDESEDAQLPNEEVPTESEKEEEKDIPESED